jgi:hypothetical protein
MEPGPTLIHIKLKAGVWVCPRKALSFDPMMLPNRVNPVMTSTGSQLAL